jgi:translation initiation factor IF-3
MSSKDALSRAIEKDLDLVLIAPNAIPPVCKIMDYGKYCFEQAKREKEAKKNQKTVELKEIRLGLVLIPMILRQKGTTQLNFCMAGIRLRYQFVSADVNSDTLI